MKIKNGVLLEIKEKDILPNGTLILPDTIKVIEYETLKKWFAKNKNTVKKVKTIVFPKHLEELSFKFEEFENLNKVEFGVGPEFINDEAFMNCTNLTEVKFPSDLIYIQAKAFKNTNLKNINLPNKLTRIFSGAFEGAGNGQVESVVFPESLKFIGAMSFADTGLKKVNFPKNSQLSTVSNNVFQNCPITSLEFPKGVDEVRLPDYLSNNKLKTLKVLGSNTAITGSMTNFKADIVAPHDIILIDVFHRVLFAGVGRGHKNKFRLIDKNGLETVYEVNEDVNEFKYYVSNRELNLPVISMDGVIHVKDGANLERLSAMDFVKIRNFSKQFNNKLDLFYYWKKSLTEAYGGRIINYPTAVEMTTVPYKRINDYVKNRRLFNEVINLCKSENIAESKYAGILKLAMHVGLLETDPGIKNGAITLLREGLFANERVGVFNLDELKQIGDIDPNITYKPALFNIIKDILRDKTQAEVPLEKIVFAINNIDEMLKVRKTPTVKMLEDYMKNTKFGELTEKTPELAKLAYMYPGIEKEQFKKMQDLLLEAKQKEVKNLLQLLDKDVKNVKNKHTEESKTIMKTLNSGYTYEWLDKDSEYNALLGYICNCCAKIGGAGQGVLTSSMKEDNVQNLVIKSPEGSIIAKATAYLNSDKGVVVFSSIEINYNFEDRRSKEFDNLADAFRQGALSLVNEYNQKAKAVKAKEIDEIIINTFHNYAGFERSLETKGRRKEPFYDFDFHGYAVGTNFQEVIWSKDSANAVTKQESNEVDGMGM